MKTATWFQVSPHFMPAFRVFWRSLLQYNSRDCFGDVILQVESFPDDLPEADDRFRFVPLVVDRYRGWPAFEPRILACYAKLELLECCDYDQILVLDSDMVCTGSLAELFERPGPFIGVGVESAAEQEGHRRHNGGLWRARRPVIGNPRAIEQIESFAHAGRFYDQCDQSAMVTYLEENSIESVLLPPRYNLQIGFAEYAETRSIYLAERHDCRILHFTGPAKPWLHEPPSMGWRERFRHLWEKAERGDKLTPADIMAVGIE